MSAQLQDPAIEGQIQSIRTALSESPPYCSGTSRLGHLGGHLFYLHPAQDGSTSRTSTFLDLAKANNEELKLLTDACQPATFGLNNKDVYDENYRKARKMDTTEFASRFDPVASGIVNFVKEQLLNPSEQGKRIRAELYKLNVYDEGSFFKPHVDTPRGSDMFGSLVVIFPTAHRGGTLFLRHEGKRWNVDSNELLSTTPEPSVAFAAFYSDIEHEVEVVSSGYRVTLTYNLYYDDTIPDYSMTKSVSTRSPDEERIYSLIVSLMEDRTKILPNGGYLGFGLQYKYPISYRTKFSTLLSHLKGTDELIRRICQRLSYTTSIQLVLEEYGYDAMVPYAPDLGDDEITEGWMDVLSGCKAIVPVAGKKKSGRVPREYMENGNEIVWVTPQQGLSSYQTDYMAYGNEAHIATFYGDACLIAKVPPPVDTSKGESADERESNERDENDESGEEKDEDTKENKASNQQSQGGPQRNEKPSQPPSIAHDKAIESDRLQLFKTRLGQVFANHSEEHFALDSLVNFVNEGLPVGMGFEIAEAKAACSALQGGIYLMIEDDVIYKL